MEFFHCDVLVSNLNERELHDKCFAITIAIFFLTAATLQIVCIRLKK